MRPPLPLRLICAFAAVWIAPALALAAGDDRETKKSGEGWVELIGSEGLDAWKAPRTNWETVGATSLKTDDPKRLAATPGSGVVYNGPGGRAVNLISRESFGDVEAHVEFMVPKGSNSGVKFEGVYEIQIFDSYG